MVTIILNFFSAGSALVAAVLWYLASTVRVKASDTRNTKGFSSASIEVGGSDFVRTSMMQAIWNKRAAIAAALAAGSQGCALLIQAIQKSPN